MTPSAPLNYWPPRNLFRVPCRRCGEYFSQTKPGQAYCPQRPCQDEKRRRGHEGKGH